MGYVVLLGKGEVCWHWGSDGSSLSRYEEMGVKVSHRYVEFCILKGPEWC